MDTTRLFLSSLFAAALTVPAAAQTPPARVVVPALPSVAALPALAEAAPEAARPAAAPVQGGKEAVLVAEDQAEVRNYVVKVLEERGYRVIVAENAGQALRAFQREPEGIDLLLTDVVMPDLSGRELASQLRKRRPGIKTLFMSGYTDEAIVRHGVIEEGVDFIQKPFSPDQLATRVREALDGGGQEGRP